MTQKQAVICDSIDYKMKRISEEDAKIDKALGVLTTAMSHRFGLLGDIGAMLDILKKSIGEESNR